ncbi:50S ribosomal protein L22 [candidate division WWE3 bacterium]|nr:50S ribosomal protein L22 [candidate division WWE3 bacterium]
MNEMITAKSKYTRISPRKVAVVVDLVRGKDYQEAERILKFTNKKSAILVLKTLKSAGANASNNKGIKTENLVVSKATVSAGPVLKRGRIVGRSRSSPVLKRTSHITIELKEKGK